MRRTNHLKGSLSLQGQPNEDDLRLPFKLAPVGKNCGLVILDSIYAFVNCS